jgi:hypothetical protein
MAAATRASRKKISGHPRVWPVRGRVVFDLSRNPFIPTPYFQYAAHSIIKTSEGKLLHITQPTNNTALSVYSPYRW